MTAKQEKEIRKLVLEIIKETLVDHFQVIHKAYDNDNPYTIRHIRDAVMDRLATKLTQNEAGEWGVVAGDGTFHKLS